MAVKIRFTRIGKTHDPYYRIIAIDERRQRDGQALEILGTYNPNTKELIQFHNDRIEAWISKGAIPTDAVKKLQKQYKREQSGKQSQDAQSNNS